MASTWMEKLTTWMDMKVATRKIVVASTQPPLKRSIVQRPSLKRRWTKTKIPFERKEGVLVS
jgi:hypothetical protein